MSAAAGSPKTRVVFMGTPEFALPPLRAIHGSPEFEIVGVYCQPDRQTGRGLEMKAPPVKRLALEFGYSVFQPEKMTLPGEFEKLAALKPDVIVVVAFGQILKKNVLELPRLGCVNIHSSLLPKWRGAAPIHWAMLAGDAKTGVTTMKLVEKLDAGAILLQEETSISGTEKISALHDRLSEMGAKLILETLQGLVAGTIVPREQDESKVTYASKLTKGMEILDPALSVMELDRRVRALNPWPGTSVVLETGERLKIKEAHAFKNTSLVKKAPGSLYESAGMLLLGASDGALELTRVQWDGKKEITAAEFLNGLRGRGKTLPIGLSSTSK